MALNCTTGIRAHSSALIGESGMRVGCVGLALVSSKFMRIIDSGRGPVKDATTVPVIAPLVVAAALRVMLVLMLMP